MAAFGEVSGQLELSELLTELRRAPMASEIPPRWRQFEAAKHTRNGSASQKHLVAMEGQPSQLRFPGASAGPPEQAVFLAHAICHAKREAHAESAQGFELSGAARGVGPGAPQRQSMAQAEVMVGSREEERWRPQPGGRNVVAAAGKSCHEACAAEGGSCVQKELEWANTCEALGAAFACEAGCGHQVGPELPAYAASPSLDTHRQCLISDIAISKCEAKYGKTSRLCRCVFESAAVHVHHKRRSRA